MSNNDLLVDLTRFNGTPAKLMEVCGTHTMACARYGIYDLLPSKVKLLSGPGCPVCVTDGGFISTAITLARREDVIITTFGDMLRVPSDEGNIEGVRADGGDVRVVYSPMQSIDIARNNPQNRVIFLGVGFETTIPTIAMTILKARELDNLSFLTSLRLIPPALSEICCNPDTEIDGFLCPGHVSVIIGADAYKEITEKYRKPCVISGFSANDIVESVALLLEVIKEGRYEVINNYSRAVNKEGNIKAQETIEYCFDVVDIKWRGLGVIKGSGVEINDELSNLDARRVFDIEIRDENEPKGCRCGDVLAGIITPLECKLFMDVCDPLSPVGPCMVSSEGACAAYYKYGRTR